MARELLPIVGGLNQDPNESGLGLYGNDTKDAYISRTGTLNKRPGYVEFCDFATGQAVDSIFWIDNKDCALAVSGGEVFKITDDAGTFSQITTSDNLEIGARATKAHFGTSTYLANGGKLLKYDWSAAPAYMADVDAPTTVTHCAFFDNYLIATNTATNELHRSGPGVPDTWAGDYDSAESCPDDLTAMYVGGREILLVGPESLEFWYNDGVSPFRRSETKILTKGILAPYSMVMIDGRWYGVSEDREVVRLEGVTPVALSNSIAGIMAGLSSVVDARADLVKIAGHRFYIINFPAASRTLVYDPDLNAWYEWCTWNSVTAEYEQWKGICHCYCSGWNINLIGDRTTGKIYKLSTESYSDDGDTIRMLRRTPWISHETLRTKQGNGLHFLLKRTSLSGGSAVPNLVVKWRNDGDANWTKEYTVPIGKVGDTEFVGELVGGLGQYVKRQYEFYTTADYEVALSGVEEDYEVLWS